MIKNTSVLVICASVLLAACGTGLLLWPGEKLPSKAESPKAISHSQLPPICVPNASAPKTDEFVHPVSSEAVETVTTKRLVTKEIEKIRLGDVVVGHNPKLESERKELVSSQDKEVYAYPADEVLKKGLTVEVRDGAVTKVSDDSFQDLLGSRYLEGDVDGTDITPALWRFLDMEMPKPDGSFAKLSVARPLWWIEHTQTMVGRTIDLGLHEIGISGEAKVLAIKPCTADSRTLQNDRYVVTGTIKHQNAIVWDLVFEGDSSKSLGVTANHPIFSFDRDVWVPAGDLKISEKVSTINGIVVVTGKSQRPQRQEVFNLEVHKCHAYLVSLNGILAHNTNVLCNLSITIPPKKLPHHFGHAADFGITGKWNKANGQAFADALQQHVARSDILRVNGSYRTTTTVTHYFDPVSGNNVMIDKLGNLVGSWKLSPTQILNLLTSGNVQ